MSGIGSAGAAREWMGAFVLLAVIGGFFSFGNCAPKRMVVPLW